MSEELTAKEALQITAEICKENACNTCPFTFLKGSGNSCRSGIAENADKTIEICKEWKVNHAEIETEWVHVCRVIEDTGNSKRCVYEKDIDEDEILPFDTYDKIAEDILKEYIRNHEGNFFAVVERICRKAVRQCT